MNIDFTDEVPIIKIIDGESIAVVTANGKRRTIAGSGLEHDAEIVDHEYAEVLEDLIALHGLRIAPGVFHSAGERTHARAFRLLVDLDRAERQRDSGDHIVVKIHRLYLKERGGWEDEAAREGK